MKMQNARIILLKNIWLKYGSKFQAIFPGSDFTITDLVTHCNTETDLIFYYQLISFNIETYDQTLKGSIGTAKSRQISTTD